MNLHAIPSKQSFSWRYSNYQYQANLTVPHYRVSAAGLARHWGVMAAANIGAKLLISASLKRCSAFYIRVFMKLDVILHAFGEKACNVYSLLLLNTIAIRPAFNTRFIYVYVILKAHTHARSQ